jgi:hypothetical protein
MADEMSRENPEKMKEMVRQEMRRRMQNRLLPELEHTETLYFVLYEMITCRFELWKHEVGRPEPRCNPQDLGECIEIETIDECGLHLGEPCGKIQIHQSLIHTEPFDAWLVFDFATLVFMLGRNPPGTHYRLQGSAVHRVPLVDGKYLNRKNGEVDTA